MPRIQRVPNAVSSLLFDRIQQLHFSKHAGHIHVLVSGSWGFRIITSLQVSQLMALGIRIRKFSVTVMAVASSSTIVW